MKTFGVVFVATKDSRYIEEAFLSAESIKNLVPKLSVTLFTDRHDNALCDAGCFDAVHQITSVGGFGMAWAEGQLDRVACLQRTPYDYTLHLDTDTRVYSAEVGRLFEILKRADIAMVEDPFSNSYAASRSGRRMFNAGLILYRRTDAVIKTLHDWEERVRRNFKMALQDELPPVPEIAHVLDEDVRRLLLRMDQIALMEFFSPDLNRTGLEVKALDQFWNYRSARPRDGQYGDIRILHSDDLKSTTRDDILRVAFAWGECGRASSAQKLYDYVGCDVPQVNAPRSVLSALFGKKSSRTREEWETPALKSADLHIHYGQMKQAALSLGKAAEASLKAAADTPAFGLVLAGQARVALAMGDAAEALTYADQAAQLLPRSNYVALAHGSALMAAGRNNEGVKRLAKAAAGGYAQADQALGQHWLAEHQYGNAAKAFARAVEADPADMTSANNLLPALLGCRDYAGVVRHADRLLSKNLRPTAALAFKYVALTEQGSTVEFERLMNFDALIRTQTPGVRAGYDSVASFNRALATALIDDQSLVYEPIGHTTRFGKQTATLADSPVPVIQVMNAMCLAAAAERIKEVRARSDHPFDKRVPRTYRLHSWAVVMGLEGHQSPHFHPSGWLSGVYYVTVPDDVCKDDPNCNGWLEFGRGEERWHRPSTCPPVRRFLPREGEMITFPSYFWHATRPLKSNKPRISFAFDIVPA